MGLPHDHPSPVRLREDETLGFRVLFA